jgi:RNA polymerase sigma-70 factor (ECF subfamily)
MGAGAVSPSPGGEALLAAYDDSCPHVYGYLLSRCGKATLAEDLTSETFLAAVDAVRSDRPPPLSRAWLIGIARHKLADHWRRQAREANRLRAVADSSPEVHDPWEAELDELVARQTLASLSPQHRLVLTLRYVDDLPVADVAAVIDRTLHATEALLVRARAAFRRAYPDDRPPREEGHRG